MTKNQSQAPPDEQSLHSMKLSKMQTFTKTKAHNLEVPSPSVPEEELQKSKTLLQGFASEEDGTVELKGTNLQGNINDLDTSI
mmetsp:Transcript_22930/g.35329  ORF Transcript_22930/g.35329 Transcript_22930/m.35329 type:complete len:83 (+) Transcript_22930:868-1116(+)